jgi:hypothetical protein
MEKLNLEPDKIIHILLKHLMDLKNETAFLKKFAALHSSEDGIPKNRVGINNASEAIPKNRVGINNVPEAIPKNRVGINIVPEAIPKNRVGINNVSEVIPKNRDGINIVPEAIPKNRDGINNDIEGISKNRVGVKDVFEDISKSSIGINDVSEALSNLNADTNGNDLLHTVFEKELLKALEEYLKNGDGQTTLYDFYTDFVEAVAKQNSDAAKARDTAVNLRLEDTHYLPAKIAYKDDSITKLMTALHGHLPNFARKDLYRKVAIELINLQSLGKATSTEIREFTGMSVTGFAKHLPKLMRYGLIKKQAPLNYVLTDVSNHIFLELFGIPKTEGKG